MNPTLLQQPYSIGYPLAPDNKCLPHEQRYSNSNISSNEYLERRNTGGLPNASLGQTLALTAPSSLDYNANLIGSDASYNSSSHLILSPPSSIDGTTSSATNSSSTPFVHSNIPKISSNTIHGNEHFSSGSNSYLPASWSTQVLNDLNAGRTRAPSLHQHLSPPPQAYGPTLTMPAHYQHARVPVLDTYNVSRIPFALHDPLLHRNRQFLSSPFASGSYPPSFSSMPQQPSSDPKGPPFEDTQILNQLVTSRSQPLNLEISASIPKGFFQVERKWTCYRRNYFTVTCAFSFVNSTPDTQVFLQSKPHSQLERVREYAVSISAKTAAANSEDSQARGLVQHTPKRDKQTESVPCRHLISPAQPQHLSTFNGFNQSTLYHGNPHFGADLLSGFDTFNAQTPHPAPPSYTFERIQFQKATANNGKRRAQQQYFHVVVELQINVGRQGEPDKWVIIATKQSYPMVVRGRSPGHYKDNRRDSQSSMDRDRGAGGLGDGSHGGFNIPPLGGNHPSNMEWIASHPRHSHHYGHSYAPMRNESDSSSISPESSTTFTGSPVEDESQQFNLRSYKNNTIGEYGRPVLSSVSERMAPDSLFPLRTIGTEQEFTGRDSDIYCSTSAQHAHSTASFDFSATTHQQTMRISS